MHTPENKTEFQSAASESWDNCDELNVCWEKKQAYRESKCLCSWVFFQICQVKQHSEKEKLSLFVRERHLALCGDVMTRAGWESGVNAVSCPVWCNLS